MATRKWAESSTTCSNWADRKPWPDALEAFTGERQMSGKAMVEYFAPLKEWLDEQNEGKPTGLVRSTLCFTVAAALVCLHSDRLQQDDGARRLDRHHRRAVRRQ